MRFIVSKSEQLLIQQIEQRYDCTIHNWSQKRAVFVCTTDKGKWIIKRYPSKQKFKWLLTVTKQLHERGFTQTIQYIPTPTGSYFFPFENDYITVMHALPGREGHYTNYHDVLQAMNTLANFHIHSANIVIPHKNTVIYHPPLLTKWEKRMSFLYLLSNQLLQKRTRSNFEQLIITNTPHIMYESKKSLHEIHQSSFQAHSLRAIQQNHIIHRDVASHNFLLNEKGESYLIDLDTTMYDSPLVDIVQLLSRAIVLHHWDFHLFHDALESYQKVRPLSDEALSLIIQLMRFPDNFFREIVGLYEQKNGYEQKKVFSFLSLLIEQQEQKEQFFRYYA